MAAPFNVSLKALAIMINASEGDVSVGEKHRTEIQSKCYTIDYTKMVVFFVLLTVRTNRSTKQAYYLMI